MVDDYLIRPRTGEDHVLFSNMYEELILAGTKPWVMRPCGVTLRFRVPSATDEYVRLVRL